MKDKSDQTHFILLSSHNTDLPIKKNLMMILSFVKVPLSFSDIVNLL